MSTNHSVSFEQLGPHVFPDHGANSMYHPHYSNQFLTGKSGKFHLNKFDSYSFKMSAIFIQSKSMYGTQEAKTSCHLSIARMDPNDQGRLLQLYLI